MTDEQTFLCPKCQAELTLRDVKTLQPADDIVEYVLECPGCQQLTHVYFDTADLMLRRDKLSRLRDLWQASNRDARRWDNYAVAQAAYKRDFDATQKRLRRKFNINGRIRNAS